MNALELEALINDRRDSGGVILRIFNDPTPLNLDISQQCKLLAQKCGFETSGRHDEIDHTMAERILVSFMHREMAYNCRCIPLQEAKQLAQQFLEAFPPEETQFFTNASFEERVDPDNGYALLKISSWNSITDATFETGVIAISPAIQGIFWFEDED
jgi:hypothetical protein